MLNSSDVTIIMPSYKEDPQVVMKTYCEMASYGFKVIIVDDGGGLDLPIDDFYVISYPANMGYGYALKQGIKHADTEIVMTCDSDGQHSASDAKKLYEVFKLIDNCAMLVGCRWNLKEVWYRWFFRKIINFIASCWTKHFMQDLNSGMRIFRKDLAIGYSEILCDTFSFTTSFTICLVADNHKVAWFPIDVKDRACGKSHVSLLRDGFITVWYIFYIGFALRTRGIRKMFRSFFDSSQRSGVSNGLDNK